MAIALRWHMARLQISRETVEQSFQEKEKQQKFAPTR
eukprot:CAMPEP_0194521762 /NCGR_PEP_ID=MMETSP0253-20130528/56167_1 /TAXON_ID=2966 /ORGANISM="Noctiluca scintillans" /LENGTH=36 /DNA_ID= /DNA_START= /DNA_END= /DNA_ORIENTATION=